MPRAPRFEAPRNTAMRTGLIVAMWCAAGGVLLYAVILFALLLYHPPEMENWFRPRGSRPFAESRWKATSFGDGARYWMANDLVESGRLIGKSKSEVKELLGLPTSEYAIGPVTSIEYELVTQRSFPAGFFLLP